MVPPCLNVFNLPTSSFIVLYPLGDDILMNFWVEKGEVFERVRVQNFDVTKSRHVSCNMIMYVVLDWDLVDFV